MRLIHPRHVDIHGKAISLVHLCLLRKSNSSTLLSVLEKEISRVIDETLNRIIKYFCSESFCQL